MRRPFFVDTDTASDAAGNVSLDLGVQNALYVVEQCSAAVPVFVGAEHPLLVELETASTTTAPTGWETSACRSPVACRRQITPSTHCSKCPTVMPVSSPW